MLCMAQVGLWSWTIVRWVAGAWRPPGRVTSATWWRHWRHCCCGHVDRTGWRCQVEDASLRSWGTTKKVSCEPLTWSSVQANASVSQLLHIIQTVCRYTHLLTLKSQLLSLTRHGCPQSHCQWKRVRSRFMLHLLFQAEAERQFPFISFVSFIYILKQVGGI